MFKKKSEPVKFVPPNKPVVYPKWTFAKVNDKYWLVLDKTRMQFVSERAFWSWQKPYVESSESALSKYTKWKKIGFAPGTLVRSMDNQFWFITGSKPLETERRLVATPDFFTLGYDARNAIIISNEELFFMKEGDPIDGL